VWTAWQEADKKSCSGIQPDAAVLLTMAAIDDKILLSKKGGAAMPTGIIIDVMAVILGGITGNLLKSKLSESLKDQMNNVMGLCALCMGISTVVLMKNLPAVVFSVILGTLAGLLIRFGSGIQRGVSLVLNKVMKDVSSDIINLMVTAVVLFSASGTGIYGSLDAGMTGNHSVLIAKAILDFFTAVIFACKLGKATSFIGIPQFLVLFGIFSLAKVIVPLCSDVMIADFKACGGFVLVATGLRIMKVKDFPVADMTLAMVLVMPVSYAWVTWILPLIA
jgi:uncharacterized membrane protein YqgA involved in biofilm formation